MSAFLQTATRAMRKQIAQALKGYGTGPGLREARMAAERRQGKLIEEAKRKWEKEVAKNLQYKFCVLGFTLGVGGGYVLRYGISFMY